MPILRYDEFLDRCTQIWAFVGLSLQSGRVGVKTTKIGDYLKIDMSGHQTFLGPN